MIREGIKHLVDTAKGKHALRTKRSSQWPAVEKAYKAKHPACEICGRKHFIQVHHKQPFHLRPDLELDPDNLISLCEPPHRVFKCHLIFGHVGNFRLFNPTIGQDAPVWHDKLIEAHNRRERNTRGKSNDG